MSICTFLVSQESKWLSRVHVTANTDYSKKIGAFFFFSPFYIGLLWLQVFGIFHLITTFFTIYLTATRCLSVLHPIKFRNFITVRKTLLVSVIFFFLSVASRLPVTTHFGVSLNFDPRINTTRYILWVHPNREIIKDITWTFVDGLVCVGAQITLLVCVFVMVKVFSLANDFRSKASVVSDSDSNLNKSPQQLSTKDARIVKQLVLVSSIFIICNTPKLVTFLSTTIEPQFDLGGRFRYIYQISDKNGGGQDTLLEKTMINGLKDAQSGNQGQEEETGADWKEDGWMTSGEQEVHNVRGKHKNGGNGRNQQRATSCSGWTKPPRNQVTKL
ncbi:chemosensory receptor c [Plakobranchus ocellatus]|uniref:Chemosensory receptor c n=1 Tax=Plakobranchus ocellatus TaxID=259542 RepID=A0AAV3YSW9_9GAST|nr:chemosensory receptor c [Plakobranchus ocellatus]